MKRILTLMQSFLLLLCVILVLCSCARERARTDIALEMTDEDSVEAIIDQDLLTAGNTIVNIEEDAGLPEKNTVTYVDNVDMQKPVLVETGYRKGEQRQESVELDEIDFGSGSVTLDDPVIDVTIDETSDDVLLGRTDEDQVDSRDTLVIEPVVVETTTESTTDTVSVESDGTTELVTTDTLTDTSLEQPSSDEVYGSIETSVSYPRHTVKRGDTLWSISRDYGCSISELCAANNLSRRDILRVGQSLVIPKLAATETTVTKETVVETSREDTKTSVEAPDVETEPMNPADHWPPRPTRA